MDLIAKVDINKPDFQINYNDRLLFLGSCFSGNIGNKFKEKLFDTQVNPFSVIFNPISILKLIDRSLNRDYFIESDWIQSNGIWVNLDLHGSFSSKNLSQAVEFANKQIDLTYEYLSTSNYLFLTFGTAWVYNHIKSDNLVANCHKIPQKEFKKSMLGVDEIFDYASKVTNKLKSINPDIAIIYTVSPVRHWADGAHNNNLSKAVLHLSIEKLLGLGNSYYFPSYEIVIDELRDYRFFKEDMNHPNDLAVEYIWDKITLTYFSDRTLKEIGEIEKLISALNHRAFNPESVEHQKFLKKQIDKIQRLKKEIAVDFGAVEAAFLAKIG
jgi:hypothetical protein